MVSLVEKCGGVYSSNLLVISVELIAVPVVMVGLPKMVPGVVMETVVTGMKVVVKEVMMARAPVWVSAKLGLVMVHLKGKVAKPLKLESGEMAVDRRLPVTFDELGFQNLLIGWLLTKSLLEACGKGSTS
jgi:hypothetical protein